uniref:enoyl-CoA hydratase-related protein n=1 Tax=Mycolicibacterium poriferae TaxID=39694 RepID=UPI00321C1883
AAVCDLRIATTGSRFGVPIARTVGNCLSMANYARLVAGFGAARAKRMLLLGEILDADEARACGFLAEIVENNRRYNRWAQEQAALAERATEILGRWT